MAGFKFTISQDLYGVGLPPADIVVVPDKGFNKTVTPRVLVATFGDGYEQRVVDGINPIEENYTLNFATRPANEIDEIVQFFEYHSAATPFSLTVTDNSVGAVDPFEKTIQVVCTNYTQVYNYDGYYSCTATLKRVYLALL